ncbi:hypothetical protein DdX_20759 [Ditylenchus destructor]|uniref:Uncharacterized protein n=1 Tax=Ditylenchus destructor TaxID=166010 RepID=A0AAD4QW44_9BILA|nr:hypothetical protein DdX_20759 [Ditylenchus destructor]
MSRFNCMYLIRCGYPDSHKYQEIDFSDYGWQTGDLKMAELLISTGNVFSDALEKLKRTPLIHAAINGQTHLVSILLRKFKGTQFGEHGWQLGLCRSI